MGVVDWGVVVVADARVLFAVSAATVADSVEGRFAGLSEPAMDSAAAAARSTARRGIESFERVVDVVSRTGGAESVSTPKAPFLRVMSVTRSSFEFSSPVVASCPVAVSESVMATRRRTAVDGRSAIGDGGASGERLIVRHNEPRSPTVGAAGRIDSDEGALVPVRSSMRRRKDAAAAGPAPVMAANGVSPPVDGRNGALNGDLDVGADGVVDVAVERRTDMVGPPECVVPRTLAERRSPMVLIPV